MMRTYLRPIVCGAMLLATTASLRAQAEYLLKPLDTVRITVYQEDDLTTEARIPLSGEITFPLLGTIPLAGKTATKAITEITARLERDYIINPSVNLAVIEFAPERVTVMGEVQKPGTVLIPGESRTDIIEAIAIAGGYTEEADPRRITLRRRSGTGSKLYKINGEVLTTAFYLQPLDVIVVAERTPARVTVMGEVQKPGVVELLEDHPIRLLEAIALAGGYSEIADRARITVRRRVDGAEKIYLINGKKLAGDSEARPFYVQPNDVIVVAESFF